jgi:hypothetical protein
MATLRDDVSAVPIPDLRLYRGITTYLDNPHGLPEQTEKYSALKDRVGVLRVNAVRHKVYVSRESKLNFRRRCAKFCSCQRHPGADFGGRCPAPQHPAAAVPQA